MYCPECHEDMDFDYCCDECGRTMCGDCYGDPAYDICLECMKIEKMSDKQKLAYFRDEVNSLKQQIATISRRLEQSERILKLLEMEE